MMEAIRQNWNETSMYGKAYESMYTGSMLGAGCNVFAVWNYVIAKTQRSVIELNPKLIAVILGGSEKEIVEAIEYLCRPDAESRSKEEDGRKMIREGQFQYRVVNWAAYQRIRDANDLKEYNRVKQAEYRARVKSEGGRVKRRKRNAGKPLPGEASAVAAMERGDHAGADAIMEASLEHLQQNGNTEHTDKLPHPEENPQAGV